MEERQEQFNGMCRNHTAWVLFHAGAAIAPMSLLEELKKSNHHFCELMDRREEIITDLYAFRNHMWDIAHSEKGYEKYTQEDIQKHGSEIIEKAQVFFHYLRGLSDAKAGSKGKKDKKVKPLRKRGDSASTQGTSGRTDDVGQHVGHSGNSSTDAARG